MTPPAAAHLLHPLHALVRLHRCHLPLHGHRSESGSVWGQKDNSPIMFYLRCQCGIDRPKNEDEDLYTLYLIVNKNVIPLDPRGIINISVPFPFCHYVVRVVVVSETSRAVTPVLRCAQRSVAREMDKEERVLALPEFTFSTTSSMPTRAVFIATCGHHPIYLEIYRH